MWDNKEIIYLLLIPVALGFIKMVLSDEIAYWYSALLSYYFRTFDLDGNPSTHDWCMLYNPGCGTWDYVSLTFQLRLWKGGNGVYVHRYDRDWRMVSVERVPFARWSAMSKAHLCCDNIPDSLARMIRESPAAHKYR